MSMSLDSKIATLKDEVAAMPSDTTINFSSIPGVMTASSLILPDDLPEHEWVEVGRVLFHIGRAVQFWIGDWIRHGEKHYGETYTQALEETDYSLQTLMNMAYVAGKIEPSRRRENVSWSHHAEVASLPPEKQAQWLETAEETGAPVSQFRKELRQAKELPEPTEITRTITVTVEQDRHAQEVADRRNLTVDEAYGQAVTEAFEWSHG